MDEKTFILDISVTFNNALFINIEMQVNNYDDWTDRSLSYLCRKVMSYDILPNGSVGGLLMGCAVCGGTTPLTCIVFDPIVFE